MVPFEKFNYQGSFQVDMEAEATLRESKTTMRGMSSLVPSHSPNESLGA